MRGKTVILPDSSPARSAQRQQLRSFLSGYLSGARPRYRLSTGRSGRIGTCDPLVPNEGISEAAN
jgi:Cdc6-like AAA superfamily ATPase